MLHRLSAWFEVTAGQPNMSDTEDTKRQSLPQMLFPIARLQSDMTDQLSIKVRGPKNAVTLLVSPAMTYGELQELFQDSLEGTLQCYDDGDCNFLIMTGFPPKALLLAADDPIGKHLENNANIRVQLKELSGIQVQGKGGLRKTRTRAKKNASEAKTFATVNSTFSTNNIRQCPKDANTAAVEAKAKAGSRVKASAFRRRAKVGVTTAENHNDIASQLLDAVSGGAGSGNRVLRAVFRSAVEHQYNTSKAVGRLFSVQSNRFRFLENRDIRVLAQPEEVLQVDVVFHRGTGLRGEYSETVDLLPKEALRQLLIVAVQSADDSNGREVLKPINLSRCSPRIFWSLVYHYGTDLMETITRLLKGVDDCHWLNTRKRELSERGKTNKRIQEELECKKRERIEKSALSKSRLAGAANDAAALTEPSAVQRLQKTVREKASRCSFSTLNRVAMESFDFESVISEEYQHVISSVLGSEQLLMLALADAEQVLAAIELSHPSQIESLALGTVVSWIETAQLLLLQLSWWRLCGEGCERIRVALCKLRIRIPSELLVWKSSAAALCSALLTSDSRLAEVCGCWPNVSFNEQVSSSSSQNQSGLVLNPARIQWMLEFAGELVNSLPFVNDFIQLHDDDTAPENDNSSMSWESSGEWIVEKDGHPWLDKRCRVVCSLIGEEFCDSDEVARSEEPKYFYWIDGVICAYLPPTADEPMALWKVCVEPDSVCVVNRYEDLESHEVASALSRFAHCPTANADPAAND